MKLAWVGIAVAMVGAGIPAMSFGADRSLEERIESLEREIESARLENNETAMPAIEWAGLIEFEGTAGEDYDNNDYSDLTLATAVLGASVQANDWVSGTVALLFEEGDTPLEVDEAIITIADPNGTLFANFGRTYVPFGNYETNLVSDTLVLEVSETRETAAQLGFENDSFNASAFIYNGDSGSHGSQNIEQFGVNAGLTTALSGGEIDAGLSYVNSLADSDTLQDAIGTIDQLDSYVGGVSGYFNGHFGAFNLFSEYLTATSHFQAGELGFKGDGAKPQALNVEVGYGFELAGKPATVAAAAQWTDEALALELPHTRYLAGLSVEIVDATSLGFEIAHDEDYSPSDGGTGDSGYVVTAQLGLGF